MPPPAPFLRRRAPLPMNKKPVCSIAAKFFIVLVRLYQLTFSSWTGWQCRFIPTCSNYAIEAFERHGAFKGLYLTTMRLLRCHPLGGNGYDPVPDEFHWKCWRHDHDAGHSQ